MKFLFLSLTASILFLTTGCSHQNTSNSDTIQASISGSQNATYKLTFTAIMDETVSAGTHLTKFVGVMHKTPGIFWIPGGYATEGLRLIAERGQQPTAINELTEVIASGDAESLLIAPIHIYHPANTQNPSEFITTFNVTKAHPYLSLASMIGPSPDWFVGVYNELLVQNGEFISSANFILYAYEAGTKNKNPHIPIARSTNPAISHIIYGTLKLEKQFFTQL